MKTSPLTRQVALVALASAGLAGLLWRLPHPLAFDLGGQSYELGQSHSLRWLCLSPLLLVGLRASLADLPWQQRALSLLFRLAFLTLGVTALALPSVNTTSARVANVFLLDVSVSISDAALAAARSSVEAALRDAPEGSTPLLIAFAERPRLVPVKRGGTLPELKDLRSSVLPNGGQAQNPGTDLQAAFQLALATLPSDALKRITVLSDGRETHGTVEQELPRARELGVKVFSVPPNLPPPREVAIRSLDAPAKVAIGESFQLESELYATSPSQVKLQLFQGETLNGLDGSRELSLAPGLTKVSFKSVVHVAGSVNYKLQLLPLTGDSISGNNVSSVQINVPGRPTVLYVEGQPQRASYFANALTAQQFDVDVRQAVAFPGTLAELSRFDFVVLSDVAAEAVSPTSQGLIERYVSDLGGGLLFAGGEAGFSLGGWNNTPLERILPVRMDAKQKKEIPSVALALVIDRSGSMAGLPLEMAKAACAATVTTLQGDDLIEVIAFDGAPTRYVKMQPARYQSRIQGEIARIVVGGGTSIFPALDAAYQDISTVQARRKHVILLTDGRADSQGIRDLVQAMLTDGITVTTVGLGDGADADLLRMVAETGGGRYHSVPDPNSLPRIFTRETELIAPKSAVQDWFPVQQTSNADFLKSVPLATAPLLHGYVPTELKSAPAQQLLAAENGDPILARLRVGLGYTLAWTSDLKNLWAVDWLRWPHFSRFWGQLVREHMRKHDHRELPMRVEKKQDHATAIVDAFSLDERFDNGLVSTLSVVGSSASQPPLEVPFHQVAPGHYEADIPLNRYGSFTLKAEHRRETTEGRLATFAVSYGRLSNPYPAEYESFKPDLDKLQRLAHQTQGEFAPAPALLFDSAGETLVTRRSLWPRLVQWMLGLFFADLLLRRLRLFDLGFARR